MKGVVPTLIVAAAMAGLQPGAVAESSGKRTLQLRHVPLGASDAVVSRPGGGMCDLTLDGRVLPPTSVTFTAGETSRAARIGAYELVFLRPRPADDSAFAIEGPRGPIALSRAAGKSAIQPVTLQTAAGPLTIAVPRYVVSSQRDEGGVLRKQHQLWYRNGGVRTGKVDGTDVCFYDSDFDTEYRPSDDSMRVGSACSVPVFAPIGKYFATSKGIYQIERLSPGADVLEYSPYSGPTGKLSVRSAGNETHLILVSEDREFSIALPCNGSTWPVIPGRYSLAYGIVCTGNGQVGAVIKPSSVKPFDVVADKVLAGSIGEPELEFEARASGDKVTVDPGRFKIVGKAGEEYAKARWASEPTVVVHRGDRELRGKMKFG